jgi:hypothetical protein
MDVRQQIEAPINAYMRWETSDEQVQQLLAYWIYRSRKAGKKEDPFRDWMLAERLLHSQSVLGVALAYIGMICPDIGDCTKALTEAIDATLEDWIEILGEIEREWSASDCANKILSERGLACALGFRLTRVSSEYCANCSQAAWVVSQLPELDLGEKKNWLLCETCANILRGFKMLRSSPTAESKPTSPNVNWVQEALKQALKRMRVSSEKHESYVTTLAEKAESPFVRGINAMADL